MRRPLPLSQQTQTGCGHGSRDAKGMTARRHDGTTARRLHSLRRDEHGQ